MIAARQIAFGKAAGKGLSAKDYVQDGLVAMWDGIENAGWGVHDASATVWKDLVGTNDLSFFSIPQIGDDFIYFGDDALKNNCAYCPFAPIYDKVVDGYVAEVVVRLRSGKTMADVANATLATTSGASSYVGLMSRSSGPFSVNIIYTYYQQYDQYRGDFGMIKDDSAIIVALNAGSACTLSLYNDKTLKESFFNGESKSAVSGSYTPVGTLKGYERYDTLLVGAGLGQVGYNANTPFMEILCVRLYKSTIGAEEIAYNYNIDKQRFGL